MKSKTKNDKKLILKYFEIPGHKFYQLNFSFNCLELRSTRKIIDKNLFDMEISLILKNVINNILDSEKIFFSKNYSKNQLLDLGFDYSQMKQEKRFKDFNEFWEYFTNESEFFTMNIFEIGNLSEKDIYIYKVIAESCNNQKKIQIHISSEYDILFDVWKRQN